MSRLELEAALMGAKLGNLLKQILNLNISQIFYWSNSNIGFVQKLEGLKFL